jgi:hypothetical protein
MTGVLQPCTFNPQTATNYRYVQLQILRGKLLGGAIWVSRCLTLESRVKCKADFMRALNTRGWCSRGSGWTVRCCRRPQGRLLSESTFSLNTHRWNVVLESLLTFDESFAYRFSGIRGQKSAALVNPENAGERRAVDSSCS